MIMHRCWLKDPDDRPTFSDLESDLNNFLTSVAGYLDFNEFVLNVCPDPEPLPPHHEETNGSSVASDEKDCAELVGEQVKSAELNDTVL